MDTKEEPSMSNREKTVRLVTLGFLIALVVVLQVWGSGIKVGQTSFSLVLIPIAVGAMLLGPSAGALLGFVFGLITLIAGITAVDPFTNILFQEAPVITSLICLGKGTAAGFGAGWAYRLVAKRNEFAAAFCAAAAAPLLNTGLFAFGSLFVRKILEQNFMPEGTSFFFFLFVGIIGVNFLVEFSVNMIVTPALHRIVKVAGKQLKVEM